MILSFIFLLFISAKIELSKIFSIACEKSVLSQVNNLFSSYLNSYLILFFSKIELRKFRISFIVSISSKFSICPLSVKKLEKLSIVEDNLFVLFTIFSHCSINLESSKISNSFSSFMPLAIVLITLRGCLQ